MLDLPRQPHVPEVKAGAFNFENAASVYWNFAPEMPWLVKNTETLWCDYLGFQVSGRYLPLQLWLYWASTTFAGFLLFQTFHIGLRLLWYYSLWLISNVIVTNTLRKLALTGMLEVVWARCLTSGQGHRWGRWSLAGLGLTTSCGNLGPLCLTTCSWCWPCNAICFGGTNAPKEMQGAYGPDSEQLQTT